MSKPKKPPARAKPVRNARPASRSTPPAIADLDMTVDERIQWLGSRIAALEDRSDRMADALAPALRTWENIRRRIPRWILSETTDRPGPRELEADDSENE